MKTSVKTAFKKTRLEIRVYRAIATDPRCPKTSRWLLGAALAYAVSPIDLIPDFIPILGQLDDLIVVPLLLGLALRSIPEELLSEHRTRESSRMGLTR